MNREFNKWGCCLSLADELRSVSRSNAGQNPNRASKNLSILFTDYVKFSIDENDGLNIHFEEF